jgi:Rieske Fe-S protein
MSKLFVSRNLEVTGTFIMDHVPAGNEKSISDLAPGEAGIVNENGQEAAAFKDEESRLHAVSPNCTHMYCKVEWNNAEKSWDCPCHGSRFDSSGKILHAPATKDLSLLMQETDVQNRALMRS